MRSARKPWTSTTRADADATIAATSKKQKLALLRLAPHLAMR